MLLRVPGPTACLGAASPQAPLGSLGVLLKQHPCPVPPPFSWLLLTRVSHFSGPGAESSGSPAQEGSRSLIRLAVGDAFTVMHDTKREQVSKQELAANSSTSARKHQGEKWGENGPGAE